MNEDPKKATDADTLLAFRDGLLDAETQRQVEERLRFSREDRDRLEAFDRDLDFMKTALVHEEEVDPDLWAVRRKVQKANRRTRALRVAIGAAAVLTVVAAGAMAMRNMRGTPVPRRTAVEYTDAEYLHAAVAQIEYETELLRAQIEKSRSAASAHRAASAPRYAETAAILLESARYWGKPGGDAELSRARYVEILAHFPESSVAAVVVNERPVVLFGDKPL